MTDFLPAWFRFVALLCLLTAGCTLPSASTSTSNTLIYGRGEDANTLDPINTDIGEAVNVIVNVFDTLVTHADDSLEMVPGLATEWKHSDDGKTWTFQIRRGVLFHDGTTLDAAAVKYSFDRLLLADHPDVYDKARPYQPSYNMIKEVRQTGEFEIEIELHEPNAVFLTNLTMFPASIVSPTAVAAKKKVFAEQPVGTGPFRVTKWDRDQRIVLTAFEQHWRGKSPAENIVFLPVKESATRIQQLQRGEIHIADNLPPDELDVLAQRDDIVVQAQDGMNVAYLSMQMEKPPLNSQQVREAIWLAIDKETLVQVAYAGHAEPAVTLVPPKMWGHHDTLKDRPFNRELAKQRLQEAAAKEGFALPLSLTLNVMNQPRPYLQQPRSVASFLKDSLREIGIELKVETLDVNEHFTHLMAGKHQLALAGWHSDNNDPDNFLYSLLDSDNISEHGNNLGRYRSEEFHQLMLAGQRELDLAKRLAIYQQAQEVVFADAPIVPLVHTLNRVAQSKRVKDYRLHPSGLVKLRHAHLD